MVAAEFAVDCCKAMVNDATASLPDTDNPLLVKEGGKGGKGGEGNSDDENNDDGKGKFECDKEQCAAHAESVSKNVDDCAGVCDGVTEEVCTAMEDECEEDCTNDAGDFDEDNCPEKCTNCWSCGVCMSGCSDKCTQEVMDALKKVDDVEKHCAGCADENGECPEVCACPECLMDFNQMD